MAPLTDGRWAYRLNVHHHTDPTPHEHVSGITDTIDELVTAHAGRCCPITAVHDRLRPRTQSIIARAATLTIDDISDRVPGLETLATSVDCRVIVPEGFRDPWLVAADASADNRTGTVTWAVVTGAGWVRLGRFHSDRPDGERSQLGELRAAIEALRTFRTPTTLTLLSDNRNIPDLIKLAQTRSRKRTPHALNGRWLAEHRDDLLGLLGERTVTPQWQPRTHPMIALTDAFTRPTTHPHAAILHTTRCDADDPDHTRCQGGRHRCALPVPEG